MKQAFLSNVQTLRGAAAAMVVWQHCLDQLHNHPIAGLPEVGDPTRIHWGGGVDIFFIISGFIMYYLAHRHFATPGYPREFFKRRIIRVAPLYWLFTSLLLLTSVLAPGRINHADTNPLFVAASYLFVPMARPSGQVMPLYLLGWTLNYEFFFYAMFALALMLPRRLGLPALFAFFIALALAHPLFPNGPLSFWSDAIILEFLVGIVIAHLFVSGIRIPRLPADLMLAAGLVSLLVLPRVADDLHRVIVAGVPALLITAPLILSAERKWWPGVVFAGDMSFSLYLSHPFSLNAMTAIWGKLHLSGLGTAPYLVALLVASLIGGALTYRLIETPMVGLLRRRFEPRREILAA